MFKGDPLDPARGQRYRDEILLPGGSREETDSLKVIAFAFYDDRAFWTDSLRQAFLGRPPNSDAFLKELFGDVPSSNL